MQQPNLIIIAGCNGAGKSTYSSSFVENTAPFDFDKSFLLNYNALFDSDIRADMARNQTIQEFEHAIESAF
jgi:adenylate kinase family enzyme